MRAYIARNVLGAFAFDESGRLIEKELFLRNAEEIAEKLGAAEAIKEEGALAERLGDYEIILERDAPNLAGEILRSELNAVLAAANCSRAEHQKLLREVSLALAKLGVKEFAEEKDRLLIQAIAALDDVDEAANLLSERLREWYSLHFPELDAIVKEHKKYAQLAQAGVRNQIAAGEEIKEAAEASIGAGLGERDSAALAGFAKRLYELYEMREELEGYVFSTMAEIAPNVSALAGAPLGAKLIALSGGIENLARMPASRIQILGAKKARFLAAKPPKHGIIFQHPSIKGAAWWQRGKIARSLAAKIAIAARADALSKKQIADRLKKDFERRVEAIKRSYASEPKKMRIIRNAPEKRKKWRKRA